MQTPHPRRVAAGEIIIDGDDVHALAGNGIQIGGQGRHQRFALAGPHFRNFAEMQHHAANQLHVEMAHPQHPLARLAHYRERFRQQVFQTLALTIRVTLFEFIRLRPQRLVRERGNACFQRVNAAYRLGILFNQPVIAAAENFFE